MTKSWRGSKNLTPNILGQNIWDWPKNWMHEQIVVNKVSRATYLNTTSMIADIFTKSPGAMVGGGATWKAFAKMLVY